MAIRHTASRHWANATLQVVALLLQVLSLCGCENSGGSTTSAHSADALEFISQGLGGDDIAGLTNQNVGIAGADMNGDGRTDLVFGCGRHAVDQSHIRLNLAQDATTGLVTWSLPQAIGVPGGYYNADVANLSFLSDGHLGVLLAGGSGSPGTTPARLYDVSVTDCNIRSRDCKTTSTLLWEDPKPQGDRNGAFAAAFGRGGDPAIVLAGRRGISVFVRDVDGLFKESYSRAPLHNRYAGLGSGTLVSGAAVIVAGSRQTNFGGQPYQTDPPTNDNLIVIKDLSTNTFNPTETGDVDSSSNFGGEECGGYYLQATGIAMGDLNGDGNSDIVEANDCRGPDVPQRVHFLDNDGHITSSMTLLDVSGRTASIGSIFADSPLPDIALGTSEGAVILFANLGVDNRTGHHLGFEQRNTLLTSSGGSVRSVYVGPLHDGTVVVACAVASSPNHVFYTKASMSVAAPETQIEQALIV